MTAEEKKDLVRRYYDEFLNTGNLDALDNYLAADAIDHAAPPGVPSGIEGSKMFFGMFFSAFPGARATLHEVVVDGDKLAVRGTVSGTHSGPFMGMPPSGKSFTIDVLEVIRVANGKYVEHWGGIDTFSLMQQLGMFDQAEARAKQYREMAVRYIEAINNDDFELLAELIAPDFKDQAQVAGMASGFEGMKQAHEMLRAAFPDVTFSLEDVLVEGEQLVMRAIGRGTNQGAFFGIPPTGKEVTWTGMRILRVADGKFVEGVNEFDQVGILQQLGVVPSFAPPVDVEANKALVRRLYEEENKGNIDIVDELMSPDFVMHGDALNPLQKGLEPLKQGVRMTKAAFPDLTVTVETMVADGDKVATRLRWRGTHQGEFMGIPATGKEMTWTAITVNRIENGKIVERWFNTDVFGLLQQFGLIPSMGG